MAAPPTYRMPPLLVIQQRLTAFKEADRLPELSKLTGITYAALWKIARGSSMLYANAEKIWRTMDLMDEADAAKNRVIVAARAPESAAAAPP